MNAREAILAAVKKNRPTPAVPLPDVYEPAWEGTLVNLGYKEHFTRMPEVMPTTPHRFKRFFLRSRPLIMSILRLVAQR